MGSAEGLPGDIEGLPGGWVGEMVNFLQWLLVLPLTFSESSVPLYEQRDKQQGYCEC